MGAGLGLVQLELRAAGDDVLLMLQVVVHHVAQGQHLGLAVDQGQHVRAEGFLEAGVLVQEVQHDLRMHVLLQLDDDAHTLAVGFVADVADALNALLVHQLCDLLHQLGLVDLVGDLGHDDAAAVVGHFLDVALGANLNAAVAGVVGLADAAPAQHDAAGGEVRALDVLHQVVDGAVGVFDHADHAVDHLAQVVGRDVGGHADRDAAGAVDQQVREAGGQDGGLHQRLVKVGVEVDGVLLDALQQVGGQLGHAGLGVTHGRRAVAVDGAVVALAVHQCVADVEGLGQAHHGVVDGGVAVGVELTQHVAHQTGGLAVGLVGGHAQLVHIVEDTAVHGLQTVAHVRQRAVNDNGHGVGNEALLHLLFQIDRDEFILNVAHCLSPYGR